MGAYQDAKFGFGVFFACAQLMKHSQFLSYTSYNPQDLPERWDIDLNALSELSWNSRSTPRALHLDLFKSALLPNQKFWLISELRSPMQKLFSRGYWEAASERSCRGLMVKSAAQPEICHFFMKIAWGVLRGLGCSTGWHNQPSVESIPMNTPILVWTIVTPTDIYMGLPNPHQA